MVVWTRGCQCVHWLPRKVTEQFRPAARNGRRSSHFLWGKIEANPNRRKKTEAPLRPVEIKSSTAGDVGPRSPTERTSRMDRSSSLVGARPCFDLSCFALDAAKEPSLSWQCLPRVGPIRFPPWTTSGALSSAAAKSTANGQQNRSIFSRVEPIPYQRHLAIVTLSLMEPTQSPGPSASTRCADREKEAKCGR